MMQTSRPPPPQPPSQRATGSASNVLSNGESNPISEDYAKSVTQDLDSALREELIQMGIREDQLADNADFIQEYLLAHKQDQRQESVKPITPKPVAQHPYHRNVLEQNTFAARLEKAIDLMRAVSSKKEAKSTSSPVDDNLGSAFEGTILPDGSWDWCGRNASHVDFEDDEQIPLKEERHLGHGVNGPVFETTCKGAKVAWKKVFCRYGVRDYHKKEINILKTLRHKHVISLVGTYEQHIYLGLLLHPVAVMDLATMFEHLDVLRASNEQSAEVPSANKRLVKAVEKLRQLFPDGQEIGSSDLLDYSKDYLSQSIGCIAQAISFLHSKKVRHKDLKPSNILLLQQKVVLTDFDRATDFADSTMSSTDNGERGTPKYFSPEAANRQPCGRASDMFSLGCILTEIIGCINDYTMDDMKKIRDKGLDESFQSNIDVVAQWLVDSPKSEMSQWLSIELKQLLLEKNHRRLTIGMFIDRIQAMESLRQDSDEFLHFSCCRPTYSHIISDASTNGKIVQTVKYSGFGTYDMVLELLESSSNFFEKMHIFTSSDMEDLPRVLSYPHFRLASIFPKRSQDIGIVLILRHDIRCSDISKPERSSVVYQNRGNIVSLRMKGDVSFQETFALNWKQSLASAKAAELSKAALLDQFVALQAENEALREANSKLLDTNSTVIKEMTSLVASIKELETRDKARPNTVPPMGRGVPIQPYPGPYGQIYPNEYGSGMPQPPRKTEGSFDLKQLKRPSMPPVHTKHSTSIPTLPHAQPYVQGNYGYPQPNVSNAQLRTLPHRKQYSAHHHS